MDSNRVSGTAKSFAGKAEGAIGRAAGDAKPKASGRINEAEGVAQKLYGQAKDTVTDAVQRSWRCRVGICQAGDRHRRGVLPRR